MHPKERVCLRVDVMCIHTNICMYAICVLGITHYEHDESGNYEIITLPNICIFSLKVYVSQRTRCIFSCDCYVYIENF